MKINILLVLLLTLLLVIACTPDDWLDYWTLDPVKQVSPVPTPDKPDVPVLEFPIFDCIGSVEACL